MDIKYTTEQPPIDQYFKLFETTGWNDNYKLSEDEILLALSNSQFMVSAYDDKKLVGFGRIVSDGIIHAMIFDMIIDPYYQHNGIGTNILKKLLNYCCERNIRDIQLFCAKGKVAFYEKNGFVRRPENAPGMEYKKSS